MFIRIFFVILTYFVLWSVAKPPMQAADEFSHTARVESIPDNIWFASGEELYAPKNRVNPYINSVRLREQPFHPDRRLTDLEVSALKTYQWGEGADSEKIITLSHSYATAFFAPEYAAGHSISSLLQAQPFESNWIFRFFSSLFAALLFTYFTLLLKDTFPRHWVSMAVLTIVNPQLGFTLSSIHPDSVFTPAAAITALLAYRACNNIGRFRFILLAFFALLAMFAKPLGIPVCIALVTTSILFGVFFRSNRKAAFSSAAYLIGAMLIAQLSYFLWVKLEIYGVPIRLNVWEYVEVLADKPRMWFRQFFGTVGWLDTAINAPWHGLLLACLALNALLAIWFALRNAMFKPWVFFLTFASIFIFGLLLGEFRYLEKAGYSVQGRYLFAILPLLALVMYHEVRSIRTISTLFVIVYSCAYYNHTIHRYFASGWYGWSLNLPFLRASQIDSVEPLSLSSNPIGSAPAGILVEGAMISYNLTSPVKPNITAYSSPPPIQTELLLLPEPNTWRVSLLYGSPAQALTAQGSLAIETKID